MQIYLFVLNIFKMFAESCLIQLNHADSSEIELSGAKIGSKPLFSRNFVFIVEMLINKLSNPKQLKSARVITLTAIKIV